MAGNGRGGTCQRDTTCPARWPEQAGFPPAVSRIRLGSDRPVSGPRFVRTETIRGGQAVNCYPRTIGRPSRRPKLAIHGLTPSRTGAVTHGSSQVTRDLDVCAVLTRENLERLRQALAEWDPRHRLTPGRLSFLSLPPPGEPVNTLNLETNVGVLDILSSVLGVGDFERLKRNAERLEVDGRTCWVMSLPDLILAKEAMGRGKDQLTAAELRVIAAQRKA